MPRCCGSQSRSPAMGRKTRLEFAGSVGMMSCLSCFVWRTRILSVYRPWSAGMLESPSVPTALRIRLGDAARRTNRAQACLLGLTYVAVPGGALMYYLFNWSVEKLGASKAGMLLYSQTVFITLLAYFPMKRSPTAGKQLSFQAKLENWAEGMDYCAVPVPASVTQALGTKDPRRPPPLNPRCLAPPKNALLPGPISLTAPLSGERVLQPIRVSTIPSIHTNYTKQGL